ncbi:hypothetical protein JCM17960_21750 [Magnetospira thiophila]
MAIDQNETTDLPGEGATSLELLLSGISSTGGIESVLDGILDAALNEARAEGFDGVLTEAAADAFVATLMDGLAEGLAPEVALSQAKNSLAQAQAEAEMTPPTLDESWLTELSDQDTPGQEIADLSQAEVSELMDVPPEMLEEALALFTQVLRQALAQGVPLEVALAEAREAVDAFLLNGLDTAAGGDDLLEALASGQGLGSELTDSEAFQQALGEALANGADMAQAMQIAAQAQADLALADQLTALPQNAAEAMIAALAMGEFSPEAGGSSAFLDALGQALARGLGTEALDVAGRTVEALEQARGETQLTLSQIDELLLSLATGVDVNARIEALGVDVDAFTQALSEALGNGLSLAEAVPNAISTAQDIVLAEGEVDQGGNELLTALATGNADALGGDGFYEADLSTALEKGVDPVLADAQASQAAQQIAAALGTDSGTQLAENTVDDDLADFLESGTAAGTEDPVTDPVTEEVAVDDISLDDLANFETAAGGPEPTGGSTWSGPNFGSDGGSDSGPNGLVGGSANDIPNTSTSRDSSSDGGGNDTNNDNNDTTPTPTPTTNSNPVTGGPLVVTNTEETGTQDVDLLSGATDPEGSTLTLSNMTLISGNDVGVSITDNVLSVDTDAYAYLGADVTETLVYSYTIQDGSGGSVTQTATVTIIGENDLPVVASFAVSDSPSDNDSTFQIDLLAQASDVDSNDTLATDSVTVRVTGGVAPSGDVLYSVDNDSGIFSIDPSQFDYLNAGEQVDLRLDYNVSDGHGGSVATSATFTVTGANDAPEISGPVVGPTDITESDSAFQINLLANATDADAGFDLDTASVAVAVSGGITPSGTFFTVDDASGILTIDPSKFAFLAASESVDLTVTYNVIDNEGGVTAATATTTITGEDDPYYAFSVADHVATGFDEIHGGAANGLSDSDVLRIEFDPDNMPTTEILTALQAYNNADKSLYDADNPFIIDETNFQLHLSGWNTIESVVVQDGVSFAIATDPNALYQGANSNENPSDVSVDLSVQNLMYGNDGSDQLSGGDDSDMLYGGTGNDDLSGDDGDDLIQGDSGNDNLSGGAGNDVFRINGTGDGFDTFDGGDGNDTILGSDGDDNIGFDLSFTPSSSVEVIDGRGGHNVLLGDGSYNTLDFSATELRNIASIDGGAGVDSITGSAAADTIVGGGQNDVLSGGDGDDVFLINGTGDGFDQFNGGAGSDTILGGDGDDTIGFDMHFLTTDSVEVIDGGAGYNVLLGDGSYNTLDFSATELRNIASIDGGAGVDSITGSSASDTIVGGAGNDILSGGAGDDVFRIDGDAQGYDSFVGGLGTDTILGGDGDDMIGIDVQFLASDGINVIDGGAGVNVIRGDGSYNTLDFSATVLRNIDSIDGGAGRDTITGSKGDDVILGGADHDRLDGQAGDDVLTGGTGNDTFVFTQAGHDTVTDFNSAQDKLDFDGVFETLGITSGGQVIVSSHDSTQTVLGVAGADGNADLTQFSVTLEGVDLDQSGLDALVNSGKVIADKTSQTVTPDISLEDNQALTFDGSDDYVTLADPAALSLTGPLTLEAWVRPDVIDNTTQSIVSNLEDGGFGLQLVDGLATFSLSVDGTTYSVQSDSALTAGEWVHLAGSYDAAGNMALYVNGVQQSDVASPVGTVDASAQALMVGGDPDASGAATSLFSGAVDEVRLWADARSETEIQETLGRQLNGNESDLSGYWNFNEGSGTTLADGSGNGHAGTLSGGATFTNLSQPEVALGETYKGLILGTDAGGESLSYALAVDSDYGTMTMTGNTYTYEHTGTDATDDGFAVTLTDASGNQTTETIHIDVQTT